MCMSRTVYGCHVIKVFYDVLFSFLLVLVFFFKVLFFCFFFVCRFYFFYS